MSPRTASRSSTRTERGRLRLVVWRPRTRADCEGLPRPCPFVGCRYNTYLDLNVRGQIRPPPARRHLQPDEVPGDSSCALDVSESASTRAEVAQHLGMTDEAVRVLELSALAKLREPQHAPVLRALLSHMNELEAPAPLRPEDLAEDEYDTNEDVGHLAVLARQQQEQAEVDRWADRVLEQMRAGLRMADAWTAANQEDDDMAAKKSKKGKKKKAGLASPASVRAPAAAHDVPVVGDTAKLDGEVEIGKPFTQRLPVAIDQVRRDRLSEELVEVLGHIDAVNEEKSAANGSFNLQLKELREKQHELAEAHRTSREKRDVRCAQYLLPGNEVIVRRLDTGEITERRTAKAEELQQNAFGDEHLAPRGAKSFVDDVDEDGLEGDNGGDGE